jgi:hypothetical protein
MMDESMTVVAKPVRLSTLAPGVQPPSLVGAPGIAVDRGIPYHTRVKVHTGSGYIPALSGYTRVSRHPAGYKKSLLSVPDTLGYVAGGLIMIPAGRVYPWVGAPGGLKIVGYPAGSSATSGR